MDLKKLTKAELIAALVERNKQLEEARVLLAQAQANARVNQYAQRAPQEYANSHGEWFRKVRNERTGVITHKRITGPGGDLVVFHERAEG